MSVCVRAWVDNRVAEGNTEWVSHVHDTNYRVGVTSLEPCSWHCKIEAQLLGGWSISEAAALRWNMFAGRVQESASNLQMIKYCCTTTGCWLVSSYSLIFFGLWTQFSTSLLINDKFTDHPSFPTLRRLFYENDSLKVLEVTDGWSIYVVMMWMDRLMRYGGHFFLAFAFCCNRI